MVEQKHSDWERMKCRGHGEKVSLMTWCGQNPSWGSSAEGTGRNQHGVVENILRTAAVIDYRSKVPTLAVSAETWLSSWWPAVSMLAFSARVDLMCALTCILHQNLCPRPSETVINTLFLERCIPHSSSLQPIVERFPRNTLNHVPRGYLNQLYRWKLNYCSDPQLRRAAFSTGSPIAMLHFCGSEAVTRTAISLEEV